MRKLKNRPQTRVFQPTSMRTMDDGHTTLNLPKRENHFWPFENPLNGAQSDPEHVLRALVLISSHDEAKVAGSRRTARVENVS